MSNPLNSAAATKTSQTRRVWLVLVADKLPSALVI